MKIIITHPSLSLLSLILENIKMKSPMLRKTLDNFEYT